MDDAEPRLERHGGPPDLPAAFTTFVTQVLGGRSLDDNIKAESTEGGFPDFGLYRDLVLVEMKHLETDQQSRIQAVLDEKIAADEKPFFYGRRKIKVNRRLFSNGDEIIRAIISKLSRSLEGHLGKANRQFRNYRARHPRKNAFNVCVILNSKIPDYTPEVVSNAIHSKMAQKNGGTRFPAIDAVLYISEKHFTPLPDGRAAYPVVIYEGRSVEENGWKAQLLNRIVKDWALYRIGGSPESGEELKGFHPVEDIPDSMSRSDAWLLEYARKPYLRDLTLSELRIEFHRIVAVNSLTFVIGSWPKPPRWVTEQGLRRFQHLTAEINRRGVDVRQMNLRNLTAEERAVVFDGLPDELVKLLNPIDKNA